jgi:integrase
VSTAIEKLKEAITKRESVQVRVGRQNVAVYCGDKRGKPYWTLAWYEGATRRRKTTSHEDEILELVATVSDSLGKGILASATLLDQPEEIGRIPITELLEFYKKHHPNFKDIYNSPTTRTVADEFLDATTKAGKSYHHVRTIKAHLRVFCKKIPDRVAKVSVKDIEDYLHGFENLKTRSNHRISLSALFHFAQRRGYLPDKEPTAVDRSERPTVKTVEPEIFSPEDFAKLLENSPDDKTTAFLVLGGLCGLRSSEIFRLNWEQVKDDHIIAGASITKTARRRVVEISGNAAEWLNNVRKDKGPVSFRSEGHLYEKLHTLCAKTGVIWECNALRHSFASYHLEFHRDPPRTSKTAGHSLRVLETVYAKLVPREDAIAWFSIFPNKHNQHEQETPIQEDDDVSGIRHYA